MMPDKPRGAGAAGLRHWGAGTQTMSPATRTEGFSVPSTWLPSPSVAAHVLRHSVLGESLSPLFPGFFTCTVGMTITGPTLRGLWEVKLGVPEIDKH